MAQCQVTGDVISFDGYDVARISSKLPATLRERLEEALEAACTPSDEAEAESKVEVPEDWLATIMKRAKEKAAAGMIELSDLERICSELKE